MFGIPRCREWTPLATQQLRLRSLIQIVGYNIRPPEGCTSPCSFYLTLHHTTMSAPYYTSERISSPHPKWKEIDSEITQRLSSTNVVIRIWCHILQPSSEEKDDKPQDTIIQTWGVYFSGLRYIGANLALNFTSDCFKSNTLVFQMHGGYFCSYKSLKLDIIPTEIDQSSLSSDSSGKTIPKLTSKFIQHQKVKESRSISPSKFSKKTEKEYSKSHSPVERGFKQNFPLLKASTSLNIAHSERKQDESSVTRDPSYIYEHSPDTLEVMSGDGRSSVSRTPEEYQEKIDYSETAENYDLRNESDGVPKYRYLALSFLKSEIRHSYNASKLQKLHLLQYDIKKRQEAVQEIKERIYKKSALANSWQSKEDSDEIKLKSKSRSLRNLFSPEEENLDFGKSASHESNKNGRVKEDRPLVSNGPRLTLKLNDLLSFKAKPSPFQRAEHVRLTKQLEILRFKRILLSDETDRKLANIRRLKEILAKLSEENQDVGLELLQDYHTLSRRNEVLKETKQSCGALRELAARSHLALANKRTELLQQLHQIFFIEQKDASTWTIINVPLPICDDEATRASNAVSDSVAAGFVAQATCLAAAFLSQPLRYKITLLGSASKILDIRPELADPNIPLFARGGDMKLFSYAMFLLNKCIAQLLWGRGLPIHDMRYTLHNLQRLLNAPSNLSDTSKLFGTYRWLDNQCPKTQSLRSLVACERGKHNRQFNRFKDAVDGQSPASAMTLRHRHTKSVGSYNDDQDLPALDTSTTSIMGSEPNIYDTKLTPKSDISSTKLHTSDSELPRLADNENRVVFTLGEDTNLINIESQKLVRLSTNNEDLFSICHDDDVKKICNEINEFCTEDKKDCEIYEGLDIVKHIDANIEKYKEMRSEMENVDSCENCESERDGVCDIACAKNVTEVIVIPSAEAILDTGQAIEENVDVIGKIEGEIKNVIEKTEEEIKNEDSVDGEES